MTKNNKGLIATIIFLSLIVGFLLCYIFLNNKNNEEKVKEPGEELVLDETIVKSLGLNILKNAKFNISAEKDKIIPRYKESKELYSKNYNGLLPQCLSISVTEKDGSYYANESCGFVGWTEVDTFKEIKLTNKTENTLSYIVTYLQLSAGADSSTEKSFVFELVKENNDWKISKTESVMHNLSY